MASFCYNASAQKLRACSPLSPIDAVLAKGYNFLQDWLSLLGLFDEPEIWNATFPLYYIGRSFLTTVSYECYTIVSQNFSMPLLYNLLFVASAIPLDSFWTCPHSQEGTDSVPFPSQQPALSARFHLHRFTTVSLPPVPSQLGCCVQVNGRFPCTE